MPLGRRCRILRPVILLASLPRTRFVEFETSDTHRPLLGALGFILVFGAWNLVLADKVLLGVLTEPVGEFGQFLAKAADRLMVHVRLGKQLRQ
jgi:hypothetical protein